MQEFFEGIKDKFAELKNDPGKRKYLIAVVAGLGVIALIAIILIANGLKTLTLKEGGASASDLIEGASSNVERNSAGGIIADINWDKIIGYDNDGNPIYATNGMVPSIGGYDMCGAPINAEDLKVIGYAEDGLPIYDYSAVKQARIRGLASGDNPDIDWNSTVGYDSDGNPIFGTFGADPNILGYDLLGNPITKGSVSVTGHTDSGMPIYDYSTRDVAKQNGIKAQDAIKNASNGKDGKNGSDGRSANGKDGVGTDGKDGSAGKDGTGKDGKDGQIVTKYVTNDSGDDKTDGASKTGDNGKDGSNGKDATSSAGATGSSGTSGSNGTNGRNGSSGSNGTNGSSGSNGADAAQVAQLQQEVNQLKNQLANGTLKGEKGDTGDAGQTGATGSAGQTGQRGETGSQGIQGQTGATGATGATGSTGATGAAGKQGEAGKDGKDGTSSYTYIRYATANPSVYPSTELLTEPSSDTKYMGVAVTTANTAPTKSSSYVWSQYKDLSISAIEDSNGVTTIVIK